MLQSCGSGQILKWNDTTNVWYCASDTGAASAVINVRENGVARGVSVDTLNFINEFTLSDGSSTVDIDIKDDSLDFSEFIDAMTLDATTSVNLYTGSTASDFRFYNSNTATEALFIHGATGRIGLGTTGPS